MAFSWSDAFQGSLSGAQTGMNMVKSVNDQILAQRAAEEEKRRLDLAEKRQALLDQATAQDISTQQTTEQTKAEDRKAAASSLEAMGSIFSKYNSAQENRPDFENLSRIDLNAGGRQTAPVSELDTPITSLADTTTGRNLEAAQGKLALGGIAARSGGQVDTLANLGALQYADKPQMKEALTLAGNQDTRSFKAQENDTDFGQSMALAQFNQGEANKRAVMSARAGVGKNSVFDTSTPEGEQMLNDYVDRVAAGDVSPDMKDLASRGVQGAKARMQAQELFKKKYPGISLQAEVTANAYWNNANNQRQRQTMDVISEQLPKLVEASNELKRMGVPFVDRKVMEAKRAAGDVTAAKYLAALAVTVEDVAKGVAGGNALTDDQLKLANQIIYKGGSPDQIAALAGAVQSGVNSRKITMYKRGGIQGKNYAQTDPWLDDNLKAQILSGEYTDKKPAAEGGAVPASGAISLTGSKAARLEELRKKQREGTLK